MVNGKYLRALEGLTKLTGSELNYKLLRSKIHSVDPPLIPFPGVYQGDLVYLDGYEKNTVEDGMINFQKHQKLCSYVVELQVLSHFVSNKKTYQKVLYQLHPVPEIQAMIKLYPTIDDDMAYKMSLYCEPRA